MTDQITTQMTAQRILPMTFSERLSELVRACFTAIWITSQEQSNAVREIGQLCRDESWRLALWDVECGLTLAGSGPAEQATDPLAAIRALPSLSADSRSEAGPAGSETTVLVLRNYHRFLGSAEIVQALDHQIQRGKQHRTIIVILAPLIEIPVELEKAFVVVEHSLPDRQTLQEIAQGVATEAGELPDGAELERVLQAAGGLTRSEAENAFSLSLVRTQRIEADSIWELKTGQLKKSGLLQLYRGSACFAELGGLESLKHFCRRSLVDSSATSATSATSTTNTAARPRGVLLLSPPGCGKSQFCKALGSETGRPVLMLDVGALLGSLVGQSEQRTRQALAIADAMAPCVLMIDEVEKAFAGFGGGAGDSGVSSRVFGTVLTWLNDHTSDVYVVCTSNDVSRLPGEFARAERFDGVFFVDLPSRGEKDSIWDLYQTTFGHDPEQRRPSDEQWTGAEIKSCCRLAALLNVPLAKAAENVVPVAVTASESVARLRAWAAGRCLDAHQGGLYQSRAITGETTGTEIGSGGGSNGESSRTRRRRRVDRGPSMN